MEGIIRREVLFASFVAGIEDTRQLKYVIVGDLVGGAGGVRRPGK